MSHPNHSMSAKILSTCYASTESLGVSELDDTIITHAPLFRGGEDHVCLSHTWVRYPGFWGHGVKCPILTTVVPGFPAI